MVAFLFRQAGVKATKNIVYRRAAGKELELDIYAPAGYVTMPPEVETVGDS